MPRRRRAVAAGRDRADAGGSRPDDELDEEYEHRAAAGDEDAGDEDAGDGYDGDGYDGDGYDGDGYDADGDDADGDDAAAGASGGDGRAHRATAVEAVRAAMRLVTRLTGRPAEGVVSMAPADGGGWTVGVEVVETRRIPDSADILAVYEATVDGDLELAGFRRTRRYSRGQVDAR